MRNIKRRKTDMFNNIIYDSLRIKNSSKKDDSFLDLIEYTDVASVLRDLKRLYDNKVYNSNEVISDMEEGKLSPVSSNDLSSSDSEDIIDNPPIKVEINRNLDRQTYGSISIDWDIFQILKILLK